MKVILILAFAMLGCGHGPVATVAIEEPARPAPSVQTENHKPTDPLLKVSFDGGLVPNKGNSGEHTGHDEFLITRAGKFSNSGDVVHKISGSLQSSELSDLQGLVDNADYVALKSIKFTGECPSAYDGDEVTYSFYTRKGVEVIASCSVAIDPKAPLFLKVNELLAKYRR